jgi:hypothetical protein
VGSVALVGLNSENIYRHSRQARRAGRAGRAARDRTGKSRCNELPLCLRIVLIDNG